MTKLRIDELDQGHITAKLSVPLISSTSRKMLESPVIQSYLFEDFDFFAHSIRQVDLKYQQLSVDVSEVRKSLRSGNFQSVIDVSQAFGYWHSGKFASDYKSLFSEYPSESLQQNL